jgi:hypothetical protein
VVVWAGTFQMPVGLVGLVVARVDTRLPLGEQATLQTLRHRKVTTEVLEQTQGLGLALAVGVALRKWVQMGPQVQEVTAATARPPLSLGRQ